MTSIETAYAPSATDLVSAARRDTNSADSRALLAACSLTSAFCESSDARRRNTLARAKRHLDKARASLASAEAILAKLA